VTSARSSAPAVERGGSRGPHRKWARRLGVVTANSRELGLGWRLQRRWCCGRCRWPDGVADDLLRRGGVARKGGKIGRMEGNRGSPVRGKDCD
jgi:hypothetical protein